MKMDSGRKQSGEWSLKILELWPSPPYSPPYTVAILAMKYTQKLT
jgi:hypothetical protein